MQVQWPQVISDLSWRREAAPRSARATRQGCCSVPQANPITSPLSRRRCNAGVETVRVGREAYGGPYEVLETWVVGACGRCGRCDAVRPAGVGRSRRCTLARTHRALPRTRLGPMAQRLLAARIPPRPLGLGGDPRADLGLLPPARVP